MTLAAILQSATEEKGAGTVVLGCVVLLLTIALLIGLIKSLRALRRPDSNRRCHLGFIFFGCGWLLYAAIAAISIQAKSNLGVLVGLAVFALLGFTGIVMAIMGLSDLKREPGKTGKVQAVLTLVLASLILVGMGIAFGFGVIKGLTQAMERRSGGTRAVFEDHRFSVQPGSSWSKLDASKVNPLAAVVYRRNDPETYFMVIAEEIAPMTVDLKSMTDSVLSNIATVSPEHKIIDQADEALNGLPGRRIICEIRIRDIPFTHCYWLHVSGDRIYQLVAWGHRRDGTEAVAEGRKAFASFTVLPPK